MRTGRSRFLILVRQAVKGDSIAKERIFKLYLSHTRYINNWDLVDASAREIVGGHLADKSREPLVVLARSENMWERRISIVATHYFIRQGEFADTLRIAKLLLRDKEDLIHKAVGWMLREVGKKDQPTLEGFLRRHGKVMPRTATAILDRAVSEGAAAGLPYGHGLRLTRTPVWRSDSLRERRAAAGFKLLVGATPGGVQAPAWMSASIRRSHCSARNSSNHFEKRSSSSTGSCTTSD